MGASDRYCLRWNNHQGNLISVLDDLLKNQTLTDVTLGVEDGRFLKCHKIILATCSPYFRTLFIEVPTNHPMILLKDVGYTEVKAILEFMYKGEVSVAYDDMAALFQVAELLQVKGLVAGNEATSRSEPPAPPSPTVGSTSGTRNGETVRCNENSRTNPARPCSTNAPYPNELKPPTNQDTSEPPIAIPTWPMSPFFASDDHKTAAAALANLHAFLPTQPFPFTQVRDNIPESTSAQSHRNKNNGSKSSTNREPPKLRSVFDLNNDDENNARSSVILQESRHTHHRNRRKGSSGNDSNERRVSMESSQNQSRTHSPRENDASMMDVEDKRAELQAFPEDTKYGISNCGTSQRQEIKRYKKYSRKDIWDAIAAVKGGLSANKAAELFSVPSRTLYDKIKKLGIPPTKHRRSDGNMSGASNLQYETGSDLSNLGLDNVAKVIKVEINETNDDPASMVETTYNDVHEKSINPEDIMDVSMKSPASLAPHDDNSQPQSPDGSHLRENANEAEDLSVSRRSSVNVIVSPNSTIEESEGDNNE